MRTLGLVLGALLLSLALIDRSSAEEEKKKPTFSERYQVTMTRLSTRMSPRRVELDQELLALQADLAPVWADDELEPGELIEAMVECLEGRVVEVKCIDRSYEWWKHVDCYWEIRCVEDTVLTIDPEGDPIRISVRAFVEV